MKVKATVQCSFEIEYEDEETKDTNMIRDEIMGSTVQDLIWDETDESVQIIIVNDIKVVEE